MSWLVAASSNRNARSGNLGRARVNVGTASVSLLL